MTVPPARLPATGTPREELLTELRRLRADDADWRNGRIFSLVYATGDPELEETLAQVSREYLAENALNPRRFPSLARLERDAADTVLGLLHGTPGNGGLTSGGTESIFLTVYVARERARAAGVTAPSIVTGVTAHPAFTKACHLLGVRQVLVPVGGDARVDVAAMAAAVDDSTALLVASAPNYPFGVIDPVPDIAALAAERGLLCHVDACLGGLLLPFWERLGEPVPPWDFRVEGVTSISADLHKYGYTFKGASALLYRDLDLYRSQWWVYDGDWGAGLYGGPTTAGTRPAPPIAGAWAALRTLGEDGYLRLARQVRDARDTVLAAVDRIEGLRLTVPPDLSVLEIGSDDLDLDAVADALADRGWFPDRQPGGLHLVLSPHHATVAGDFVAALGAAVAEVRAGRTGRGGIATYGAVAPGARRARAGRRTPAVTSASTSVSALSHLECSRDGSPYDADVVQGTSSLGAPLLARYDLDRVAATVSREEIAGRAPTLWRYAELLPVRDPRHVVSLGEGMTPLLDLPTAGARLGVPTLRMKDEGLLPTGAFKARGAAVGVSRARELGVKGIAMPTNGNAGAAWAAYAARAGLDALIVMPVDAPVITRRECVVSGAELYLVDGLIGDAGAIVRQEIANRPGWQDTSTLKEPYRIEGKKTMGYEIAEQLGWRCPDVILYPTGGGVGIIAIHKALQELQALGWITGDLPRLVAVQAAGCAPIVDAFAAGLPESTAPEDPHTVAFGITVPKALGDFLVLDAVRATGGTAVAVTDEELLAAQRQLARDEGTWICPEGAACFAAVGQLREFGWLDGGEDVVVLNTGSGLLYPDTVPVDVPTLPQGGVIPA